jgi:hypothetical protein
LFHIFWGLLIGAGVISWDIFLVLELLNQTVWPWMPRQPSPEPSPALALCWGRLHLPICALLIGRNSVSYIMTIRRWWMVDLFITCWCFFTLHFCSCPLFSLCHYF